LQQRLLYDQQVYETFAKYPETDHVFQLDVAGQDISGMVLKPWDQRQRTSNQLQPIVPTGPRPHRRPAQCCLPAAAAAG